MYKIYEESLQELLQNTSAQLKVLLESRPCGIASMEEADVTTIEAMFRESAAKIVRPNEVNDSEFAEIWCRFGTKLEDVLLEIRSGAGHPETLGTT